MIDTQIHNTAVCTGKLRSMEDALYAIGGKWRLRIIIALNDGNMRFNELQRKLGTISPRVLSNELKDLELNGFVERRVFTESPVVIEYGVTEYSHTLKNVVASLVEWGEMHKEHIQGGK